MNHVEAAFRAAGVRFKDDPPKTHDYREHRRGWGHDYTFRPKDDGMRASMMGHGCGIVKGDWILMTNRKAPSGETRYRVESIRYFSDPDDMWSIEVIYDPRSPSEVRDGA